MGDNFCDFLFAFATSQAHSKSVFLLEKNSFDRGHNQLLLSFSPKNVLIPLEMNRYGKCPKLSNTLFHTFWSGLLFMQLFLKILCGMANSVDPDQTALSENLVYKILGHSPYTAKKAHSDQKAHYLCLPSKRRATLKEKS